MLLVLVPIMLLLCWHNRPGPIRLSNRCLNLSNMYFASVLLRFHSSSMPVSNVTVRVKTSLVHTIIILFKHCYESLT